ncbi:holliday junction resolvase [Pseudomonas phage Noxifer]|uniref:Holliday junction resolvase n=1 Tax=Pseudomonas phage Noxifer TaxID=2006684 RepID=A0A1Y0SXH2_9CAUD|nr:holliday junction resolvase [Pseudomonas phage Noxifer]ARV77314.1 holliday junction resolvase [Pseudomonas phage Noxifer]
MFTLPVSKEPLRVLSIDPGSYNTGVSHWHWDFESPKFDLVTAYTLKIPDSDKRYAITREMGTDRVARLFHLDDTLTDILEEFRPHMVICESNYKGRFADAYATLVECVAVIRNVLYRYDPTMPLLQVDPMTAKKAAGVVGKSKDKMDVVRALKKRTDINWGVELDTLDEHSSDSVAIGLHLMHNLKMQPS